MEDEREAAWDDAYEDCAEREEDDEGQAGNYPVSQTYGLRLSNVESEEAPKLAEASVPIVGRAATGPAAVTAVATITTVSSKLGDAALACSYQSLAATLSNDIVAEYIPSARTSKERNHCRLYMSDIGY